MVVVDPGFQSQRVAEAVSSLMYTHFALINTHCHFDHVAEDACIMDEFGFKLFIHEEDADSVSKPIESNVLNRLFGRSFEALNVERRLSDGDVIDLGEGVSLEVLHTPGHSPGGLCLFERQSRVLFTGDTVFKDSVGRTDLAGGDWEHLAESVGRLVGFAEENGVKEFYPGHGPPGTIDDLRRVREMYFQ